MLDEIKAGVAHVRSLLAVKRSNGDKFSEDLQASLERRYASCWYQDDAERGSASRALVWHGHGGGEGLDDDVKRACLAETAHKTDNVLDILPTVFTMWIDPSCVAIRMGGGPGTYLSSPYQHLNSTINVVWGTMPLSTPSIAPPVPAPTLRVLASTPALDSTTWTSGNSKGLAALDYHHARLPSTASSIDSFVAVSRSSSMSSSGDESEQSSCPSLSSASSSHRDNNDSDSELSIEDMVGNGCYGHFDIIDDEDDQQEDAGDVTITPQDDLDVTLGQLPTPGDASCESWNNPWQQQQQQGKRQPRVEANKINYTIHDGGNVGVLGGGVRLGGGGTSSKSLTPRPQQQLQPSFSTPMPPAPVPVHVQLAPTAYRPELYDHYGAPPPYTAKPAYYIEQQHQHQHQQPQQPHGFHPSYPAYYPGLPGHPPFDVAQQQYLADMMMRPKRIRSRGRRSRGRGAGRAARRQAAAALKALGEEVDYDSVTSGTPSTMTGSSCYDDDEEEENDGEVTFHNHEVTNETGNALGLINLERPSTPVSKVMLDSSLEATPTAPAKTDEETMALVRQRAEQVANDLASRQEAERDERVRLAKAKFQAQAAHAHAQLMMLQEQTRRPQHHGLQPYSYAAAAAH